MLYRSYGRTGHQISALAMGCMRFENVAEIDRMAEFIVYLYDHGVNYFDTAPGYFDGRSEEILGAAVKQLKGRPTAPGAPAGPGQQPFYIATKTMAGPAADIRKELETSLRRLNVEAIDFYHVWCLRTWAEWEKRKADNVIDTFRRLKAEGLVKHVVASIHLNSSDMADLIAEDVFEGFTLGFCASNFTYREAGIRAAGARGLGLVAMNPLGGGAMFQAPDKFAFVKTARGDDVLRGGLRLVLSQPEITAALVGLRNLADAQAAVAAMDGLKLLTPAKFAALKADARGAFNALCTGCDYCAGCPVDIPVARLMDTYNYMEFGQAEATRARLKYHWGIPDLPALLDTCTGCGQCEEACTQRLPIRERFAKLRETWDALTAKADREAREKEEKAKAAKDQKP